MLQYIPLHKIAPGDNDRTRFDARHIINMAGILLGGKSLPPIHVRPHPSQEGMYQIASGGTRFKAACRAWIVNPSLDTIPCMVSEMTDTEYYAEMLGENMQRRDLDPLDEAAAYLKRMEMGMTKSEVAQAAGVSVGRVSDRLALLEVVPEVHGFIREGHFPLTYAVCMSKLDNNRQRIAMQYFSKRPHLNFEDFQKEVNRLYAAQCQTDMFATDSIWGALQASTRSLFTQNDEQKAKQLKEKIKRLEKELADAKWALDQLGKKV